MSTEKTIPFVPSKEVTQLKQRTAACISAVPAESNSLLSFINFWGRGWGGEAEGDDDSGTRQQLG